MIVVSFLKAYWIVKGMLGMVSFVWEFFALWYGIDKEKKTELERYLAPFKPIL